MIIHEGTATVTDGTTRREVEAGQVVVIAPGEPHAFTSTGTRRLRQTNIHVADAFVTHES